MIARLAMTFLLAAAMAGAGAAPRGAAAAGVPVFSAGPEDGDARMRGRALAAQVKARFPDLERAYDAFLARVLTQAQFEDWRARRARSVRESAPEDLVQEIEGFADGLVLVGRDALGDGALSHEEFWMLQGAAEKIAARAGWGRGAALGFDGSRTETGAPLAGQVQDGPALPELFSITVIDDGRSAVALIGPAGLLGALTGVNDRGVFAAWLHGSAAATEPPGAGAQGRALDLRAALHHAERRGAIEAVARAPSGRDRTLFLADRDGLSALELRAGAPARRREAGSATRPETPWEHGDALAATGCLALARTATACRDLRDLSRWRRLRALAAPQEGAPAGGARVGDLIALLSDRGGAPYALFGPTTRLVAFDPESLALYVNAPGAAPHRYAVLRRRPQGWFGGRIEPAWLTLAGLLSVCAGALAYGTLRR